MKKRFLKSAHWIAVFSFLILLSCTESKQEIKIERKNPEQTVLTVNASANYLLLPIEDKGKESKVEIFSEGKSIQQLIIRLAEKQVDHWVPLDISNWKGKQVELRITNLNDSAVCWKQIRQSETFEFDYNEKYRPSYHFTPYSGWANDPNGMVYYKGEYHLFYQHNPFGSKWQNMSWGHAVSKDLVNWEHFPDAITPDNLGTIFSGSAVVDWNNTAGFQTGEEKTLLAFYTNSERCGQIQSLAYSNDKGRTWTKYDKNPILKKENTRDFRDPKVFWHELSKKWIMILAVGQVMEIYSSANAKDWTYESHFGEGYGSHAGVWECPDLFELPVQGTNEKRWVLICNSNSATQYFIGNFDGKTFTCENKKEETHWMDWGKDHYATVTWSDIPKEDGRRISIAWMSSPEYAGDVPTVNFRSAMTVPREVKLVRSENQIILTNYPIRELEMIRKDSVRHENITVSEEYNIDQLFTNNQGAYELNIEISNISAEIVGFRLLNSKGEFTDFSINIPEQKWYMDRKNSGIVNFAPGFPIITSAPVTKKQSYQFRLLIDKASIECFEDNGKMAMTNIVFPSEPYNSIRFYSKGGKSNANIAAYQLKN